MSDSIASKKYPASTGEVAKMFGLTADSPESPHGSTTPVGDLPVANLPVVVHDEPSKDPHTTKPATAAKVDSHTPKTSALVADSHSTSITPAEPSFYKKILKESLPYLSIFVIGLFLYYFFFTGLNFSAFLTPKPLAVSTAPKQTAVQALEQQGLANYYSWIYSYYYDVSDPKIIDPETDNSGNGLSNFQKYLLNLNPKSYDTLGLGMADSQAIAAGINPATGAPLTDAQKNIVSQYVDMEVVMNRLTLFNLQNPGRVAGAGINANGTPIHQELTNSNATGQGFQSFGNPAANTNPGGTNYQTGNSGQQIIIPAVTGADLNAVYDNSLDINTNVPGRLEIPSMKISVPIMWTQDPKNFDKDLQSGIVHYPGTAMPGQIGTTYIAGHSSNYPWAKGSFNQVFTHLDQLAVDTSFKITAVQKNGKNAVLYYVVTSSKQYSPTDQAQFQNSGKSLVALSTCWPVGSTAKRLVVFGELTQVSK